MTPDKFAAFTQQKTFVMIKPDGYARNLVGTIISRFEQKGLSLRAIKIAQPGRETFKKMYPITDDARITRLGEKSLTVADKLNTTAQELYGTDDLHAIGSKVIDALLDYVSSGPVVPMIRSGTNAVALARQLIGATSPGEADIASIRGQFGLDIPLIANIQGRAIKNLIHGSETPDEAAHEMKIFFSDDEIAALDA